MVLLLTCALLPTRLAGKTPSRAKMQDALTVLRHLKEPTLEDLRRQVGEDLVDVLVDVVVDRRMDSQLRCKAAKLLSKAEPGRAVKVFRPIVVDMEEDRKTRTCATEGLGAAGGLEVLADVEPYLLDTDPAIRMAAVKALGLIGGPRARSYLLNALAREDDLEVKQAIDEALKMAKSGKGGKR